MKKIILFSALVSFMGLAFASDTTPPSIQLKGGNKQNVQINTTWQLDEPLSVSDDVTDSADITVKVSWGFSGPINSAKRGMYQLFISAEDLAGNTAFDTITYNVDDFIPPVINLNTPDKVCVEYRTPYHQVQPTVTDNYYSSSQISLVLTSSDVDENTIGLYSDNYQAVDGSGNIATKKRIVEVKVGCSNVNINTVNINTLSVFPNPATNQLSILGLEYAKDIQCSIFDVSGRLCLSSDQVQNIDVSALVNGIYTIRIIVDGQAQICNLVINR